MKAICYACEKVFKNKQAVRAHLRWCKPYRAGKAPQPIDRQTPSEHSFQDSRPRSQRQRLLVIDIHDRLRALQDVCLQHTQFAVSFDRMFGQSDTWKRLLMQVHDLVEGSANLLYGMLPAPTPLMLYETLRELRSRWQSARSAMTMSARSAIALPHEQDHEDDALMEELRAIELVVGQVKDLVSLTN